MIKRIIICFVAASTAAGLRFRSRLNQSSLYLGGMSHRKLMEALGKQVQSDKGQSFRHLRRAAGLNRTYTAQALGWLESMDMVEVMPRFILPNRFRISGEGRAQLNQFV